MTGILDHFKNSPYFDRTNEISVYHFTKGKDSTGTYARTLVAKITEVNSFFTPIKREKIRPEYLDKYEVVNYVYLSSKLDLTNKDNEYIIGIDGQEYRVLNYHGLFLDSGFYKYEIGGTGNAVE